MSATSREKMNRLLFMGFGVVLLLLGLIAGVTLLTTFTLRDNDAAVYQHLTQAELARSLQYEIVAADHARDTYLAAIQPSALQSYQDHIHNVVTIEGAIRSMPLTKTDTLSLAIFDNQWAVYLKQNVLVVALVQKHAANEAANVRPQPDTALRTLDLYITQTTNIGEQARVKAVSISNSAPTLTVIVSLVALVSGFITAWFLGRGINRIAHHLAESLDKLHLSHAALEEANVRLEALATTDPLTELPNHRALVATLDQAIHQTRQQQQWCSFLFIDLDHFKAINDHYGHPAGDTVLCELARLGEDLLRQGEVLGRWGGEEFVAILPDADAATALALGEQLRTRVAAHLFSVGGGIHMTCSIGVATYGQDAASRDELIAAADQAMYAAKHLGRNQVRLAHDPAVQNLQSDQAGSREEIALMGTVAALSTLIEARDHYTGGHTEAVGSLVMKVAVELDLDIWEAQMIQLAGRLHDIGKVAIPDNILRKPGPLTAAEWVIMQTHPTVGEQIVSQIPALRGVAATVRAHHERWDGKGYPDGLAGTAIPLGARIITVVDAYEAIITDRPYRQAHDPQWAIAELYRCAGAQFDERVVQALERTLCAEGVIAANNAERAA